MSPPILHVTTNFAGRGGAEMMMARLVNARPERCAIIAAIMDVSDECRRLVTHPAARVLALEASSAAGMGIAAVRLAKLIRREQPSAVLCWMYHANVIGALGATIARYRGPVVWNVRHSWDTPSADSRSTRVAMRLGRMFRRIPSGIIFNSKRSLEQHAAVGYGHANSCVIPNGFVLPPHSKIVPRRPYRVGMAARFHPQKAFPDFLAAVPRVLAAQPDVEFVAAGRGVSRDNPEFMHQVPRGAECVSLFGEVRNMSEFYRSLDLFVLSSSFGEGFPNVLAEAMSHGVPCVTTNVGDAAFVVGETGMVVPPRDPEALSQAILVMLALAPHEYVHRAAAARERVERLFDIDAIARQYDNFILCPAARPQREPPAPR